MINKNNIDRIKTLADRIEYTVTDIKKEARIRPLYDSTAYEIYNEAMHELLATIEKDVIAIYNHNKRSYSNLFATRNKQYINDIDIAKLQLTKKELQLVSGVYIDSDGEIMVEYNDDIPQKKKDAIYDKIENNIIREKASCTGYSQSDWEEYTFVYYKGITDKNTKDTLNLIIKNISYMFTVQEYYVTLVDIETRLYTSGIQEVEEVETDCYSFISYDGYTDYKEQEKELQEKGYTIIND